MCAGPSHVFPTEEASDTEPPSDSDDETDDFYSDYTMNYILNHAVSYSNYVRAGCMLRRRLSDFCSFERSV